MRDFFQDHSAIALNTATLGHNLDGYGAGWSPEQIIDACAERGYGGITYWIRELGNRAATIGQRTRDAGLKVTGLCRPPYLVGPDAAPTQSEVMDGFHAAIDIAADLGSEVLTIVVGGIIPGSRSISESIDKVSEIVAQAVSYASDSGVKLALEPLNPVYAGNRSCLVTVRDALNMCNTINHSSVGIAIDVYHVWWDLTLRNELQKARPEQILGYHLCDWLADTNDILLDRGMMGDGVADLKEIRSAVEDAGYSGACEVEIFSLRNWWLRSPEEVLDITIQKFRTVC